MIRRTLEKAKLKNRAGIERDEKKEMRFAEIPSRKRNGAVLAYVIAIFTFIAVVSAFMAGSAVNNLRAIENVRSDANVKYMSRAAIEIGRGVLFSEKDASGKDVDSYFTMFTQHINGQKFAKDSPEVRALSRRRYDKTMQYWADSSGNNVNESQAVSLNLVPYFNYVSDKLGNVTATAPAYFGYVCLEDGQSDISLATISKSSGTPSSKIEYINGKKVTVNFHVVDTFPYSAIHVHYGVVTANLRDMYVIGPDGPGMQDFDNEPIFAFAYCLPLYSKSINQSPDIHINAVAISGSFSSASGYSITEDFWNTSKGQSLKPLVKDVLTSMYDLSVADEPLDKLEESVRGEFSMAVSRCIVPINNPDAYLTETLR